MRNWIWLALFAALGCTPKKGPNVGGETHWLALCSEDADCGEVGLSCICGTCTRACSGDAACSGGACYDAQSPLLLRRCEDLVVQETTAICLAQCAEDADCGSSRSCEQGACVPVARDAGMSAESASVRIDDFADVRGDVSWSEPIELPVPSENIEGAEDWILGQWTDGCSIEETPECLRFTFERTASGAVRGNVQLLRVRIPAPPLPPATDGDVGYPPGTAYGGYGKYPFPHADVKYRLLDARFAGDSLSFRWSSNELWRDWCQLQRPYLWEVAGRSAYLCVPQDAAEQALLDPGKVALCAYADFGPLCENSSGAPVPCCYTREMRCPDAPCDCDANGCGVSTRLEGMRIVFAPDRRTADLLRSPTGFPYADPIKLRREP